MHYRELIILPKQTNNFTETNNTQTGRKLKILKRKIIKIMIKNIEFFIA